MVRDEGSASTSSQVAVAAYSVEVMICVTSSNEIARE